MTNESPQAVADRTNQAMQEGRFADALKDLATLKILVPGDASINSMMAQAYRRYGDHSNARCEFAAAIDLAPNDLSHRALYAGFLEEIEDFPSAIAIYDEILKLVPHHIDAHVDRAMVLAKTAKRPEALERLHKIAEANPSNVRVWINLAILLREDMDYEGVDRAVQHTLSSDPKNQRALQIRAQCAYDKGGKSSHLFQQASDAGEDNPQLIARRAGALLQEGEAESAIDLLSERLLKDPAWVEGNRTLAEIRWQMDGASDFARNYEESLADNPTILPLWSDYILSTAKALGHEEALQLIDRAAGLNPDEPHFDKLKAMSLTELGEYDQAQQLFDKTGYENDRTHHLAYLRFLIKSKQYDRTIDPGMELVKLGAGPEAWPYVAIAWRILEDERWQWLEGQKGLIKSIDLPINNDELAALTECLRKIHIFKVQPFAQSLRGGTQTDGDLFRRDFQEIRSLVAHLKEAVREYLGGLPSPDESHPFLSKGRDNFRFVGSWSVRLTDAGFHVNHIHHLGTISSAFYVSLPESMSKDTENTQDGWLALGEPSEELDTGLAPIRMIEPKPGRLALFPSTMWHGTRPFGSGERLTCAFDVKLA